MQLLLRFSGLAVLLISACTNVTEAMPLPAAKPAPVRVQTVAVESADVPTWLRLTGQLKGGRETELAANARGRVVATFVERGDAVKAGQILARLDVRAAALSAEGARADAQTAAAQAESAQLECTRGRALVAQGALSTQQADRLEAQCRTSDLALAAAQTRSRLAAQSVGDGVIRAPFSGVVAERYVEVGEFVQMDTKVVSLLDESALRLELSIPQSAIALAEPGRAVRFGVAGYPDREFDAQLKFVSAALRPATRDVLAEAVVGPIADTGVSLRSGMFAAVKLQNGSAEAPLIPKQALQLRGDKPCVFVVKDGVVEQRIVQTADAISGDRLVVTRGLQKGERVVLAPAAELENGQSVQE